MPSVSTSFRNWGAGNPWNKRASWPNINLGGLTSSTKSSWPGSIVGAMCFLVSLHQLAVCTRPSDWETFLKPASGAWALDKASTSCSLAVKVSNHGFNLSSSGYGCPHRNPSASANFICWSAQLPEDLGLFDAALALFSFLSSSKASTSPEAGFSSKSLAQGGDLRQEATMLLNISKDSVKDLAWVWSFGFTWRTNKI